MTPFTDFINNNHPVYEGISQPDEHAVKVVLSVWHDNQSFGAGEIYPYTIPSTHHQDHYGCFEMHRGIIRFVEDKSSQGTVLKLRIAKDFQSLEILDNKDEITILGNLILQK